MGKGGVAVTVVEVRGRAGVVVGVVQAAVALAVQKVDGKTCVEEGKQSGNWRWWWWW